MITLSLAIRNLLRNRRRSLATLLAMAIGSTSILLFGGFSGNINLEMHTRSVKRGGHLQIQHSDFYVYGSGNPMAYSISHYQQILQDIRNDEVLKVMVVVVTPTLQFGGIAGNNAANVSRTILGTSFVPADINQMRRWNDFGLRSTTPVSALEGASPDSVAIGVGVARVLQLCKPLSIADCPQPHVSAAAVADSASVPDDIAELSALEAAPAAAQGAMPVIDVLVANSRGAPNVTSLKVVQAEDQGFKELDEVTIMTRLDHIQKLIYGKAEPKVTSIILQLQHTSQIPQARERLASILARYAKDQPLSIKDFRELNPFFVQTEQMFNTIFGFVFLLIGGIVLFTVSNTMNTAVIERTVEIGTLRATGLRRSGIRRLFVTEGAILGVVGALLGVVLALSLSVVINRLDIPWLPPGTVELVPLTIRVWDETRMIIGTTLGLIVIATLSAWWPAYRASNLKIVDALRHV